MAAGVLEPAEDPATFWTSNRGRRYHWDSQPHRRSCCRCERRTVLIYLDSSALVKLAVTEPESAALIEWLGHSANLVRVSSPIVRVECPGPSGAPTRARCLRPIP